MTTDYKVDDRNRIRQLREKGSYDRATVHGILDTALIAHVGLIDDGQPVVVPMLYGREGETLFLHGARKARVIRMLAATESVCVNVTLVDAVVLARSAFHSSLNYRSVTVFGPAHLIEDPAEALSALRTITEHTAHGRWDELRAPLERELKMTGVIALDIESASAKISAKMPQDEPEDYATPVWAGLLPLESRFTKAIPDDALAPGIEPSAVVRALEGRKL